MRDRRAIFIKNPSLKKIRNNLRDLWYRAVSNKGKKLSDKMNELQSEKIFKDLSHGDQQKYRAYQNEKYLLEDSSRRSILMCVSCGKGGRDMAYNKAYKAWYCTECFDMHREYAKELFQILGKTNPVGHEEVAIHELYETFLDYEESHELELKVIREGILVYLLRFPSSEKPPYTTIGEIKKVIKGSDKAINHVLKLLKETKLIDSINPRNKLKVKLTQAGSKKAQKTLDKLKGEGEAQMFGRDFPADLEEFDTLLDLRSYMVEQYYPDLFEQMIKEVKSKKTPKEEIKRRINDWRDFYW